MDSLQAYHAFWASFGWKAYDETSVPDIAVMPYITYEAADDYFDNTVALTASLWSRSTSWVDITAKAKEIALKIGLGGIIIPFYNGMIWLKRGHPWAQRMSDGDDVRRIVLNIEAEYIRNGESPDITGTTWVWNDSIDMSDHKCEFDFESDSKNYVGVEIKNNMVTYVFYDSIAHTTRGEIVNFMGQWSSAAKKTITITSPITDDFYEYLTNNAEQGE